MCKEDVVVTSPILRFDDSGHSALLIESSVETVVDGERLSGSAQVKLDLIPRPNVYIYCRFEIVGMTSQVVAKVQSNPIAVSCLDIDGLRLNGFGLKATFSPVDQTLDVKWCPSEGLITARGDKTTTMQKVMLYLFNLDFPGHSGPSYVDLESDIWKIRIKTHPSMREHQEILQHEGGFRVTHLAKIRKVDGSRLSGEEAEDTLNALRLFLCFAKGTQCDPICPCGIDDGGELVWSQWSYPHEWERSPLSWFERTDLGSLSLLFPGFMERWSTESWRDALVDCIWWYANANSSSRGIDVGIVSAQTAMERLSYEYCVCERKLIGTQGFKAVQAADKFRLLLASLSIPLDIPSSAVSLRKVAKSKNWSDGPQALAEIRNDLVHGGLKRMNLPHACYADAWKLSLWFLEMAILAICGFKGTHWNRNRRAAEPVPWC